MITSARPTSPEHAHWYDPKTKLPCHEVKRSKGDGMRAATLADARKLGLYPSVTNILSALAKPGLENWKTEQACLAVLTAPRKDGEQLDAFVERVLQQEREHEQEASAAADLGSEAHRILARYIRGETTIAASAAEKIVRPAIEWLATSHYTNPVAEEILIGDGYAGTCDAILEWNDGTLKLVDWKTCSTLPKSSAWPEHRLQLAAYARAVNGQYANGQEIKTMSFYMSTTEPGKSLMVENPDWHHPYLAFENLLHLWQWVKDYNPTETIDQKLDRVGL